MFQRMIVAMMIFVAMLCLTTDTYAARNDIGNGNGQDYFRDQKINLLPSQPKLRDKFPDTYGKDDKWLIYWYVCGTDIESSRIAFNSIKDSRLIIGDERFPGDVTRCIREVERATFPNDNVKIFMQAGGTNIWGHEKFQSLNATITFPTDSVKQDDVDKLYRLPIDSDNNIINIQESAKIARYVYGKGERDWTPREIFPFNVNDLSTQMGSPECLKNFLRYGKEVIEPEFKPDHRVFIFVDHGNGSLWGVCSDKNLGEELHLTNEQTFEYLLNLKGINDAFTEVFGSSKKNPPFEVIAFDTCLMGTYETALSLEGLARYMVASEEPIYGVVMFNYTDFINALSKNPAMGGAKLGKVICDTYYNDSLKTTEEFSDFKWNMEYQLTMSVIDLKKLPALKKAYDKFGTETLKYAQTLEHPYSFITNLSYDTIKFGNNIINMVDLKSLVARTNTISDSKKLKNAYNKLLTKLDGDTGAVIYQTLGRGMKKCGGLSTYYEPSFRNLDVYNGLVRDKFASAPQRDLYQYLRENIPPNSLNQEANFSLPVAINNSGKNISLPTNFQGTVFDFSDLNSKPVYIDTDRKTVFIRLQQKDLGRIASVRCQLARVITKNENGNRYFAIIYWGGDPNVDSDGLGTFSSTFNGKWLMINGKAVFVQVVSENVKRDGDGSKIDGSEVYAVPIMLNDKHCNLMISCDYPDEKYSIIGAVPMRQDENSNFMNSSGIGFNGNTTDGQIYGLRQGDEIKPLYIALVSTQEQIEEIYKKYNDFKDIPDTERGEVIENELNKRGAFSIYEGDAFTVGDSITIEKGQMPDGNYMYAFEFVNPVGEKNAYSEMSTIFTIENGKISGVQDISEMSEEDLEK